MIETELKIRVRYAETDKMGVVYYGNYSLFYEVARSEFFRELGLPYKEIEERGYKLPIYKMKISYFQTAAYDDLLRIVTIVPEKPGIKMKFIHKIYNENNVLINEAEVIAVFTDDNTKKVCYPPDFFTKIIEPKFK
jgi:acyl-CoA thioester hydrolase